MKQSDIFTIIIIASIGMVGAFFASNAILGNPDDLVLKHKNISPISTEVVEPDPETFNPEAINPTVEVYVGQCEDVDQNGILDRAELVACGKASPEEVKTEQKAENEKKEESLKQTGNDSNNATNKTNEKQGNQSGQNGDSSASAGANTQVNSQGGTGTTE